MSRGSGHRSDKIIIYFFNVSFIFLMLINYQTAGHPLLEVGHLPVPAAVLGPLLADPEWYLVSQIMSGK